MELFFDIIAELVLKLLGKVTKDNKNARTQPSLISLSPPSFFWQWMDTQYGMP